MHKRENKLLQFVRDFNQNIMYQIDYNFDRW